MKHVAKTVCCEIERGMGDGGKAGCRGYKIERGLDRARTTIWDDYYYVNAKW